MKLKCSTIVFLGLFLVPFVLPAQEEKKAVEAAETARQPQKVDPGCVLRCVATFCDRDTDDPEQVSRTCLMDCIFFCGGTGLPDWTAKVVETTTVTKVNGEKVRLDWSCTGDAKYCKAGADRRETNEGFSCQSIEGGRACSKDL